MAEAYCKHCGCLIETKRKEFLSGLCHSCAMSKRTIYTTRKCAGCDVIMDLRSFYKAERKRKLYHDHACWARARTAKYESETPAEKTCVKCGRVRKREDFTATKWRKFKSCRGVRACPPNPPS